MVYIRQKYGTNKVYFTMQTLKDAKTEINVINKNK